MGPSLTYRRLRAPTNDGAFLLEPDPRACLALPGKNRELLGSHEFELAGQSIQAVRAEARKMLLASARDYTSQYTPQALPALHDEPIVMTGHQPALFHPGVWAKNFAIDGLAKSVRGLAIHVIIDNDTMREPSIRIPTGSTAKPEVVIEPFDRLSTAVPFERTRPVDLDVVRSFPSRVCDCVRPFVSAPLVKTLWDDVLSAIDRDKPLGHAFAQARHMLEQRWGLQTLEIPMSRICDTESFWKFAAHLLCQAADVRTHHNRRLREYRRVHRLRSLAQPLPDLRYDAGWVEVPFWSWTDEDPVRRSVWCRQTGANTELKSGKASWTLHSVGSDPSGAVNLLSRLCNDGWRLRPRALTATMYLRLLLCDCFVHGIGGAKYDQITDLLIYDLFGIAPPGFIALSQTTLLPTSTKPILPADIAMQRQLLRSMFHHPEVHLDDATRSSDKVSSMIEKKMELIRTIPARGKRGNWHRQIVAINSQLRKCVAEKTTKQRKFLEEIQQASSAGRILGSREWSFCLFPEAFLRDRLLDLSFRDM